jgi:hypothetical protein
MGALGCLVVLGVAACAGNSNPSSGVLPQQAGGTVAADVTATPSPAPTATPSPTPTPFTHYPGYIHLISGGVIGAPKMFNPTRGDAWPGTSAGTAGGPIDGIPCQTSMVENQFHVHAFVGILVNGRQYAVPDSIGMNGWGPLINGFVNAAKCFYSIHTHDATGMIHMEAASTTPLSGSMFTLGNFLDIWDQPLTGTGIAQYSGMVRVFIAHPPLNTQFVSGYTEYTGDPYQIPLYSHSAVWIEVGSPYVEAAQLPQIRNYTQY